jgi:hypothetical protein
MLRRGFLAAFLAAALSLTAAAVGAAPEPPSEAASAEAARGGGLSRTLLFGVVALAFLTVSGLAAAAHEKRKKG